jgi:hypothetical protein
MRPVLIPRCDEKKPTPGQAAPGLEPGTCRMQSGAVGAWPQCSVISRKQLSIRGTSVRKEKTAAPSLALTHHLRIYLP